MNLKFDKRLVIGAGIIVGVGLAAIPGVYFYNKYRTALRASQSPAEEAAELVKRVGRHIELPIGETPTIATVTDIERLRSQLFFARAKNGDKVLVYRGAWKAILYDPVADRIIEVAPLTVDVATASGQVSLPDGEVAATESAILAPVRLAMYNGTAISGLERSVEAQLLGRLTNLDVVSRGNSKQPYLGTLVVDLTGNNNLMVDEIIKLLVGAKESALPAGETRPENAEMLLILGNDRVASPTAVPTGL